MAVPPPIICSKSHVPSTPPSSLPTIIDGTLVFVMAQVLNGSGIEPLKASNGINGATGMKSDSEDRPKVRDMNIRNPARIGTL